MRYDTPEKLAAEYRRRGLQHIAKLIEVYEDSPFEIESYLYVQSGNELIDPDKITDAYPYFLKILRNAQNAGENGIHALSLLDDRCGDILLSLYSPKRHLN